MRHSRIFCLYNGCNVVVENWAVPWENPGPFTGCCTTFPLMARQEVIKSRAWSHGNCTGERLLGYCAVMVLKKVTDQNSEDKNWNDRLPFHINKISRSVKWRKTPYWLMIMINTLFRNLRGNWEMGGNSTKNKPLCTTITGKRSINITIQISHNLYVKYMSWLNIHHFVFFSSFSDNFVFNLYLTAYSIHK